MVHFTLKTCYDKDKQDIQKKKQISTLSAGIRFCENEPF